MSVQALIERLSRQIERGQCWFLHDWGKWEDCDIRGKFRETFNGQRRYCLRCNKKTVIYV